MRGPLRPALMLRRRRSLLWSRDMAVSVAMAITIAGCSTTASRAYDFRDVSGLMDRYVTQRGLAGAGLIVLERDDGVVHEEYWGDFDAERTTLIASASKMITAGVLLRLDDGGYLDIDAPVADVVAWGSGNPAITPAQLLSNSSGLVGIFPDPVYLPYLCQYLPEGSLQDCAASIFTTLDDDADVIAPDTSFRYGGGQWQVAGAVAEVASGRSWAELIDETYVQPCGLDPGSLGYSNYISQMGNGIDYPTEFNGDPSTLVATNNPNVEAGAYATPRVFAELSVDVPARGRVRRRSAGAIPEGHRSDGRRSGRHCLRRQCRTGPGVRDGLVDPSPGRIRLLVGRVWGRADARS